MLIFWDVSRVTCDVLEVDSQEIHLRVIYHLMLFSYGDMASVEILMTFLETFEGVSGLSFNPAKSSIFSAG
ncbi:hypothetical protein LIER_37472 [Lithospermum erythrorhizon]|uniref:Uncharacterized protein n=1 Tax=Lithospermum erythrorhizon TaxID=34254 RepID=A0AAV3PKQ8_LITER